MESNSNLTVLTTFELTGSWKPREVETAAGSMPPLSKVIAHTKVRVHHVETRVNGHNETI
jgi:hypothetical protein